MAKTAHSVEHSLKTEEVRPLLERALVYYRQRYPAYQPTLTWQDPDNGELRVQVRKQELVVKVSLHPGKVTVEVDLPLYFRPFKGAAVRTLDREVARWLQVSPPDSPADPS